ncbi:MAG: hypothetical protein ACRD22_20165, partial [Terriglobia bacterium]
MQIFAKLTKVDENTGIVYGRATEEVPDRSGEIFDYASSKPYFEKWSTEVSKAPGRLYGWRRSAASASK